MDYLSKVRNSNSWQEITDFILDVMTTTEGGAQEKPTPPMSKITEVSSDVIFQKVVAGNSISDCFGVKLQTKR